MEELEMLVKASQEPVPAAPRSEAPAAEPEENRRALHETIRRLEGWLAAISKT
jgi:hypothetical protein